MNDNIHIEIHRVYLKDVSFESSQTAKKFTAKWKPHLDISLNTSYCTLEDKDLYEVVLHITITARQGKTTAFLVELQQAGVFKLAKTEESKLQVVMQTHCANILFPFAREAVADLVVKGGFPQLLLSPMDFQSLYQQKVEALKEHSSTAVTH